MEDQERPKKEAVHSKLLSGRLVRKLTKEPCLGQLQENYISASKCICIGVLEWVQSYIPSRWSPQHLPLSRLHPWNSFSGRKDRKELYHAVQLKENCIGEITLKKKKSHNNQWYN